MKKSSLRYFIWCYSFFYCFCLFRVIHELNNFLLLVRVCVSILSLPTERYKSKDISITTIEIKKWTTSHESLRRARFHHINIFFLEVFLASKNPKVPWMVSTTINYPRLCSHEVVASAKWSWRSQLQVWCLKHFFIPLFTGDLRNGPLSPEICTGTVLSSFLSSWRVTVCGVVSNCSYRFIQHQRWRCQIFTKFWIFIRLFSDTH